MKEERRPTNEEVQAGREGDSLRVASGRNASRAIHHEMELQRLEGMKIELSTMTAAQSAQAIELLASIGLELWKQNKGLVHRKDLDDQDAAA